MNKIHDQRGQSLVEYVLLVALVCLAALMFFIPTIIVYQWMRHVRHADRTTSFLFAIGFTALMDMAAHHAQHLRLHHHHECCDDQEEDEDPDPGCECCEFGCVCPASDNCCRCSRESNQDCCGRTSITRCDCGDDCDCCCNSSNCPACGTCCFYGVEAECDCGDDCDCCCNQRRCPVCGPHRGERLGAYDKVKPPKDDDLGRERRKEQTGD